MTSKAHISASLPIRAGLSEVEAAVFLSVSPSHLRQQRGTKNFPRRKVMGNRQIYVKEDLHLYLNSLPYEDGKEGTAYSAQENVDDIANDTPALNPWRVKA